VSTSLAELTLRVYVTWTLPSLRAHAPNGVEYEICTCAEKVQTQEGTGTEGYRQREQAQTPTEVAEVCSMINKY
jgi:hypothetical protein